MFYHFKFATRTALPLIVMLLLSGPGWGAGAVDMETDDPDLSAISPLPETLPERDSLPTPVKPQVAMEVQTGYRFISVNDYGGRAAEYDYLRSNPVLGVYVSYLGRDHKVTLEGDFVNDKDYRGALGYDFKGRYRFNLASRSLYHNLDQELLSFSPFSLNGNAYTPMNPAFTRGYALTVAEDLARFRYSSSFFPVHLNLGYWRLTRNGTIPLRFADQAFVGPSNTISAGARPVDQQTHEGSFGLDTHLGLFDLIYDFRIRQFGEQAPTLRDPFVERLGQRFGGLFEHNSNPDSRFYAHTIRMHTSLAGGMVGAASYTWARQENRSSLTDFTGARQTYNTINNIAGDLSYTPWHTLSVALKYRRQDVERNAPATVASSPGILVNPTVTVRAPLDTLKDSLTATLLVRPSKLMTVKGEYKGEFLSRENMKGWAQPGSISAIDFPAHSEIHTGSFSLLGKPVKGLKFKAQYKYSTADNPAYADQYEEKQEGTVQVSYNAPNRWGMTTGVRMGKENSEHLTIHTLDLFLPSQVYQVPRDKKSAHGTVSLWVVPWRGWTMTGSYGVLRSSTDQAVLLASTVPDSIALTNYKSQAQIYSLNSVYHWDELLDLSLLLQQVRSRARFDSAATVDTAAATELSRVSRVESALAARADCRLAENLSWALEYTFKDYSDKNAHFSLFNGNVNSIMVYVAASW